MADYTIIDIPDEVPLLDLGAGSMLEAQDPTLASGSQSVKVPSSDFQQARTLMSQAEAEAGTATDERLISAERIAQAITALATGGGGYNAIAPNFFIGF